MKEKIKFLILIIIFVVLLILVNSMLKKIAPTPNTTDLKNTNLQENITTEISSSNENIIENVVENQFSDNLENETKSTTIETGKVIEVTESTFDEEVLKSDKTVLIDFYADWCGPCKILSPIVEEVAKENPDLKVVKIDVDDNGGLSYEYGAYYIPTLVVIKDGKEVNRHTGVIQKEDILDLVK